MSKDSFSVERITKSQALPILHEYHYLTGISKGFKSGYNYGCIDSKGAVCGVAIFTGFPVPELAVGGFGLMRDNQDGLFELSRLALRPDVQSKEHNLAGWFAARAMKMLRKDTDVRVILSYADTEFHSGTVYRALGFDDYGLTTEKKDFWIHTGGGEYRKHSRGPTKGVDGEWRPRSRKRRFVKIFDQSLSCKWDKVQSKGVKR